MKALTEKEALDILEKMPENEFQEFFNSLPPRVTMLLKGGLADWREILPQWYINGVNT